MKLKHFGTDGIRGIVGATITPDYIVKIARATASFIITARGEGRISTCKPKVVVGCDTRLSCEYIMNVLSGVLSGYGADVVNVGIVPSAALSFLTVKLKADVGIMVSASHNSSKYNGCKFFDRTGEKLSEAASVQIDRLIEKNSCECTPAASDNVGKVIHRNRAVRLWEAYLIRTFEPLFCKLQGAERRVTVHIDCAYGSGGECARRVLQKLGFDVRLHNAEYDGFNINRNSGAVYPLHLRDALKKVNKNNVNAPFSWVTHEPLKDNISVGFALDGDADRCVVVDSDCEVVHGDVLLFNLARFFKKKGLLTHNTLVATVMFNLGAEKALEREGIKLLRTPVGDSHVYEAIKSHGLTLGGETSGHIIFPDIWRCGDGLITALYVLLVLQDSQLTATDCEIYPQVTKNLPVSPEQKKAFAKDPVIRDFIKSVQHDNPDYRVIVRPSGTEDLIRVTVEGENHVNCKRLTDIVCKNINI